MLAKPFSDIIPLGAAHLFLTRVYANV
jgi:hypothetical protein